MHASGQQTVSVNVTIWLVGESIAKSRTAERKICVAMEKGTLSDFIIKIMQEKHEIRMEI